MGKRTERVKGEFAEQARLYYYANLAVATACLVDYFLLGHGFALVSLAILVLLINGFALWQRHHDLDQALRSDLEQEAVEVQREAERDARLRAKGLR